MPLMFQTKKWVVAIKKLLLILGGLALAILIIFSCSFSNIFSIHDSGPDRTGFNDYKIEGYYNLTTNEVLAINNGTKQELVQGGFNTTISSPLGNNPLHSKFSEQFGVGDKRRWCRWYAEIYNGKNDTNYNNSYFLCVDYVGDFDQGYDHINDDHDEYNKIIDKFSDLSGLTLKDAKLYTGWTSS
jgi:hypothetical protein